MKHLFFLTIALSGLTLCGFAQQTDSLKGAALEEATVSALKFPESVRNIPFSVKRITSKGWNMNAPTMAEVLTNSGGVFVQKSQGGGGSPVVRGFEASRVLLMVDGVRMNNAIYRTGHLQNAITVDPNILAYADILYGPSSTMYGSDALGGVVNMFTKKPQLLAEAGKALGGNIGGRYSSALNEYQLHADFNIAGKKWAAFTSVTGSDFGDVVQGGKRNSKYPDFGKKPFYVNTVSGTDFRVTNSNPDKQIASGYKQLDLLQKILFVPKDGREHLLNIQYSTSTNIPRYDRLTEITGTGTPRFGDWYYGPQKRLLLAYQFNAAYKNRFFEKIQSVLSFQDVEESRFDRRFNNQNLNSRFENVRAIGYTVDALRKVNKNEMHLGFDMQLNSVKSTAYAENIVTGARSATINTRYPDGRNHMNYAAVYYQHLYKIKPHFVFNGGARLTTAKLRSTFVDKSITAFPFDNAEQENTALSGNLGLTYNTPDNWRIAALISTGFRSPNIDDLGKVFDSRAGSVVVPNPELKPEYTYNGEINFNKFGNNFSAGGSVFYTLFRNAIAVRPFNLGGASFINYQGVSSEVLANQNVAKAFLYGASANFRASFAGNTDVEGTVSYTYGRYTADGTRFPLDHIPPVYGRFGVKHRQAKWNAELFSLFNGWKRIKDYNPSGEDNQQYATPDGMPAWFTVNFRAQYLANKNMTVLAGVENILDRNYRQFASGISAPGRNFVLTLRAGF